MLFRSPINVSLVRDTYVRQGGEWLVERRTWSALFEGAEPITKLSPDDLQARRAGKE